MDPASTTGRSSDVLTPPDAVRERIEAVLFGDVAPSMALGRYRLHERVGAGGMGEVWAADDPLLRRRVAIKLVHGGAVGDPHQRARIVREMRSLARVNHPNVLALFDCGTYDVNPLTGAAELGVYMVTELIAGETLDRWLSRPRPPREIVAMFVALGAGLVAAHAAGLTHRDFKPANVLVGTDGRARILDFGLARTSEHESVEGDVRDVLASGDDSRVTLAGRVVGTPRYMAPEQLTGDAVDARADQYAFCLVVAEALLDRRLFDARGTEALAQAKRAGPPSRAPRGFAGSAAQWRVLARGLQPDAEARWPGMRELLRALQRASRRLRGLPTAAALAAVAVALTQLPAAAARPCTLPEPLGDFWSSARTVTAARIASDDIWSRAAIDLDGFVREWDDVRGELCRAATAAQLQCIEAQRHDFDALLEVLGRESVEGPRVLAAAAALPAPRRCLGEPTAEAHRSDDATAAVRSVDLRLAEATALVRLGKLDAAMAAADDALAQAEGSSARLQAWAAVKAGIVHGQARAYARRRALLERGYQLALDAEYFGLAHQAAAELVSHFAQVERDADAAEQWHRHAEAAGERVQSPGATLVGNLHQQRALIARSRGDNDTEYAELTQALEYYEADPTATDEMVAGMRVHLGHVAVLLGRYDEGIAQLEPAATVFAERRDPHDPQAQTVRLLLANALFYAKRLAESEDTYARLLEDAPPRSSVARWTALGLAEVRFARHGDAAAALASYTELLARIEDDPLPDPPPVAGMHARIAGALLALGRATEAEAAFRRAIAAQEVAAGTESPVLVQYLEGLAEALQAQGRGDAAAEASARAMRLRDGA